MAWRLRSIPLGMKKNGTSGDKRKSKVQPKISEKLITFLNVSYYHWEFKNVSDLNFENKSDESLDKMLKVLNETHKYYSNMFQDIDITNADNFNEIETTKQQIRNIERFQENIISEKELRVEQSDVEADENLLDSKQLKENVNADLRPIEESEQFFQEKSVEQQEKSLQEEREKANIPVSEIADSLGITPQQVLEIEEGNKDINNVQSIELTKDSDEKEFVKEKLNEDTVSSEATDNREVEIKPIIDNSKKNMTTEEYIDDVVSEYEKQLKDNENKDLNKNQEINKENSIEQYLTEFLNEQNKATGICIQKIMEAVKEEAELAINKANEHTKSALGEVEKLKLELQRVNSENESLKKENDNLKIQYDQSKNENDILKLANADYERNFVTFMNSLRPTPIASTGIQPSVDNDITPVKSR